MLSVPARQFVAGTLAVIWLMTLNSSAAAQGSGQQDQATPISDTADRIAHELWPTGADPAVQSSGTPLFRATVTVDVWALPVPWQIEKPLGRSPRAGIYHREFLASVTPEAFRGSTMYPVGVGVDPAIFANAARQAWRGWQTYRIRKQVEAELAEFLRAHPSATIEAESPHEP